MNAKPNKIRHKVPFHLVLEISKNKNAPIVLEVDINDLMLVTLFAYCITFGIDGKHLTFDFKFQL